MMDNLKEIARNLNIEEKVYFVGYLAGKEVQKMYKAADVAVFPSTYEPFRNSCIRGNASEKFQLLYQMQVDLMKQYNIGKTGLKSYAGNANSIADSVLKILYDYNLADTLIENARKEVVQKYNWKVIAMSTLNSYKAIQKLEVKEKSNIVRIKELKEKRKETNDVKDENDITSSLLNDVTRLLKFNDRNKLFNI